MTKYLDKNGDVIAVAAGLGRDCWIVKRRLGDSYEKGICSGHRVKSPQLPPRRSATECQSDLDAYACKKKWKIYNES